MIEDSLEVQKGYYDAIAASIGVANERLKYQKTLLDGLVGAELASAQFDLIDENTKRQEAALNRLKNLGVEYIDSQREIFKDKILNSLLHFISYFYICNPFLY